MGGNSPRESAAQGLYGDLGNMNTNTNIMSNFSYPFSPTQQMNNVNQQTQAGQSALSTAGATNVADAKRTAGKNALSRGYGGAVASDATKNAGESASNNTNSALSSLFSNALNTKAGVMNNANSSALSLANSQENEAQNNIKDFMGKVSSQTGLLNTAYSNSNWFDDVLAGAKTVSTFV
jgi:hypothetical protein